MSMANELVAKRYATALFEHAKENGTVSAIESEMSMITTLFESVNEFDIFLAHPKIKSSEKKRVLSANLQAAVSAPVLNTLLLMIDRKRGDSIAKMAEQFIALAMEEKSIAEAVVYSVKPLTDDEQQAVSDLFAKKVGKQSLRLHNIIEKDLIGGLKIRIGNQIFDGSVSGKLERIRRDLVVS